MNKEFIKVVNVETKKECLISVSKIVSVKSIQDDDIHHTIVKLSNNDIISTKETTDEILHLIESV